MKWSGAWLTVATLAVGCTVAGPRPGEPMPRPDRPAPPPGVPALPAAEPAVRVGLLVDVTSARVQTVGAFEVVDGAGRVRARGRDGEVWRVARSGDGVEAAGPGEVVRVAGSLLLRPVAGANEPAFRVDGRPYRGGILLAPSPQGVTVVNTLDMETYLLGVVPREIGAGRPPEEVEAVKAQAIAARTYAVRYLGRRADQGFDVYATVADQVYGGAEDEDPVATRAVEETRGEILVHDGVPIEAFYHSTCGGQTAAIEEVWPEQPRPYLRSVSDARPGGGWYCETSNRFRWTERFEHEHLIGTLSIALQQRGEVTGPLSRVHYLTLTGRTFSGRAEALLVGTDAGDHRIRGDSIRSVLRPDPSRILNSAAITLHPEGHGEVAAVVIEGQGWGHGIGMCQVGALGRARDGHSYRDILSAYYPGTRIVRLY
jgi:stage II sporulation protein D